MKKPNLILIIWLLGVLKYIFLAFTDNNHILNYFTTYYRIQMVILVTSVLIFIIGTFHFFILVATPIISIILYLLIWVEAQATHIDPNEATKDQKGDNADEHGQD